ncbi:four helix bundle protein [candidate division KSB1 bacterium]|nr:four helix bundle protein [candidate division KSB1 bacterium]
MSDPAPDSRGKPGADLKARLLDFSLRIIRLQGALPKAPAAQTISRQLLRSGLSVGAQQREAHRAKSDADFVSKMEGALGEPGETTYWLELLIVAKIVEPRRLAPLMRETEELTSILVASVKRVKSRRTRS